MTEEENITFMLEETSNRIKLGLYKAEEYVEVIFCIINISNILLKILIIQKAFV